MTGLLFDISSEVSAYELLEDIDFNGIAISFNLKKESFSFSSSYKSFLESLSIDPTLVHGFIDLNIFNQYLETGSLDRDLIDEQAGSWKFLAITQFQNSGCVWHDISGCRIKSGTGNCLHP